jgi:hypothetical protein
VIEAELNAEVPDPLKLATIGTAPGAPFERSAD